MACPGETLLLLIIKLYYFLTCLFFQQLFPPPIITKIYHAEALFLNSDQDLSSFLLVEFGLVKFPDYTCRVSHRIFQGRVDLLEYEEVGFPFAFFREG